ELDCRGPADLASLGDGLALRLAFRKCGELFGLCGRQGLPDCQFLGRLVPLDLVAEELWEFPDPWRATQWNHHRADHEASGTATQVEQGLLLLARAHELLDLFPLEASARDETVAQGTCRRSEVRGHHVGIRLVQGGRLARLRAGLAKVPAKQLL